MSESAKIAPPYSLVLVGDPSGREIPNIVAGSVIASTSSCIAVGCLSEVDGETEFTLGATPDVNPGIDPAFEGKLKTPNRMIAVRSVLHETILEATVPEEQTTVRVWVNDPTEPDKVIIGFG